MYGFAFPRRRVKQLLTPLLPEQWKAPLRARLFGYRPPASVLPVTFDDDERSAIATIDGRIRLRFREQERYDMRYQFVENGSAIDEITSFLDLAASARTLFDVGASKGVFSQIFCQLQPEGARDFVRAVAARDGGRARARGAERLRVADHAAASSGRPHARSGKGSDRAGRVCRVRISGVADRRVRDDLGGSRGARARHRAGSPED